MATWDSAYCLKRYNALTGRPDADVIASADKYERLSEAQQDVYAELATLYPECLYNAPTQLTTSDGGYTFTFGTDDEGYPVTPLGKVRVFDNLANVPDCPLRPGVDYLPEGTQIRMPNNTPWTGNLYAQWVQVPADITAAVNPSLPYAPARILIVIKAAWNFALEGGRNPTLAALMERRWATELPRQVVALRTQFASGGGLGPLAGSWTGAPFGSPGWGV